MLSRSLWGNKAQTPNCCSPFSRCFSVVSSKTQSLCPLTKRIHFTSLLKLQHIFRLSLGTVTKSKCWVSHQRACLSKNISGKERIILNNSDDLIFVIGKTKSWDWFIGLWGLEIV